MVQVSPSHERLARAEAKSELRLYRSRDAPALRNVGSRRHHFVQGVPAADVGVEDIRRQGVSGSLRLRLDSESSQPVFDEQCGASIAQRPRSR